MKAGRFAKGAIVALLCAPAVAGISGTAHAESAPGCAGTTQIGSTAYITSGGTTFASVKQFVGCGKNWAYLYVWEGYRSTHSTWDACVAVGTTGDHALNGTQCRTHTTEIWSLPTNTVSVCTQAVGWIPDGASAKTSERC
ncbi:hypothetical protein [Planotetraspora phitsanulokensis]|uniref:hypothetical protein n=1 Tax=Planotetraspora phitsanulokensis TaxID=575192 RepID=UPI00194DF34B|nr:hypothetical protein [Planotetraspora phitsanulokensis]